MGFVDPKIRRSSVFLLRIRALLHLFLPLVLVFLLVVVVVEFFLFSLLTDLWFLVLQYIVVGYFSVVLFLDFVLYRDKRVFLRDKWIDILLLFPLFVLPLVISDISSFLIGSLGIRLLETSRFVEFGVLEIDEIILVGRRLQRLGKLVRYTRKKIIKSTRKIFRRLNPLH